MVYTYRTTTEKLPDAYQSIEESGDTVIHPQWVGGRDWLLICRKYETPQKWVTGVTPAYQRGAPL